MYRHFIGSLLSRRIVSASALCMLSMALLSVIACSGKSSYIPEYKDWITDLAEVFPAEERQELINLLAEYEKKTSHQIVVLTVPSLQGETIESFSLRVFKKWEIGHKDFGNGILLTLAMKEHKVRIEVGKGLAENVPNDLAKLIIDNSMIPAFSEGNFYNGTRRSLEHLMKAAEEQVIPAAERSRTE